MAAHSVGWSICSFGFTDVVDHLVLAHARSRIAIVAILGRAHQVTQKFKTGYKTGYVIESKVIKAINNEVCSRLLRFNV